MANLAVAFDILARDKASATLDKVGGSLSKVSGNADHTNAKLGHLGGAFTKLGSIMGGEVGEAFNKVGEGFDLLGEKQGKLGSKLIAGGGALTGIGALLSNIGSKDKAAMQQLDAAVTASGKGFDGFKEEVEKAVKSQENYAHKAPDTIEALRVLTQATGDPKKALEELNTVSDLAAAKHESLSEAASSLAKVHGGAGRILKEFGLTMGNTKAAATALTSAEKQHEAAVLKLQHAQKTLSDIQLVDGQRKKLTIGQEIQLRNARDSVRNASEGLKKSTEHLTEAQKAAKEASHASEDAITSLGKKLKGQAAASVDTFSGKLDVFKTKAEDAAAKFGQDFGGAITAAGPILAGFGAALTLFNSIQEARAIKTAAATAATEVETVVTERSTIATKLAAAGQFLLNAALDANPIGIVIVAVAALAAGLIYAYNHSATFRKIVKEALDAVKTAAEFVFNFFKDHWPLLLGILTGPFELAVGLIVQNFDAVKSTARDVLRFVVDKFLSFASTLIHAAASAFGWVPGIGPKLRSAAKEFDKFAASVRASLSDIHPPPIVLQVQLQGPLGKAAQTALTAKLNRYASGTTSAARGWALVGEEGPELMWMDGGEKVKNANATRAAFSGSSNRAPGGEVAYHVTINNPVAEPASDSVGALRRVGFLLGT